MYTAGTPCRTRVPFISKRASSIPFLDMTEAVANLKMLSDISNKDMARNMRASRNDLPDVKLSAEFDDAALKSLSSEDMAKLGAIAMRVLERRRSSAGL